MWARVRPLINYAIRSFPEPVKAGLRRIPLPRGGKRAIHQYWRTPSDGLNDPDDYASPARRTQFLLGLLRRHVSAEASLLEIGCNVGRNLNGLYDAGFKRLSGIEISKRAITALRKHFPGLAEEATIHVGAVEDLVQAFHDDQFDLVFTMAVLEHIHPDSEWIFPEVVRITRRFLVTVEDEDPILSWRIFPRNYREVFEAMGMEQLESLSCQGIEGLGRGFVARVFRKP